MNTEQTERPRIKLTTLDKMLSAIAHVVMGVTTILALVMNAKGYSPMMPFIYLFIILIFNSGFTILQKHNVYPRVFNFYLALDGVKFDITTQNALHKVILRMIRWMIMLTCSLFTYNIVYTLIPTLQNLIIDIPFWLFIISIAFVFVFYFIKATKINEKFKQENASS